MNKVNNQKTPAVIFVHGFGSSVACWDKLIELLEKDSRVKERFLIPLRRFPYYTPCFNFHLLLGRIPRIEEIAQELRGFIDSHEFHGRELTLVGHSQGGLIILSYLADMVAAGRGQCLSSIRQVILVATPLLGSTLFPLFRKLLSYLFFNPQERALRVLDPYIADLRTRVQTQIVAAREMEPSGWPIPIRSFYGDHDGIVLEASARGPFNEAMPLPADHFSIIRPKDADDRRYTAIVNALLEPLGHANVFEIDLYEISLTVEPREKKDYTVSHGNKSRTVTCDNWAKIVQSVTFSRNNRCRSQYTLRYFTKNDGFIDEPTMSYTNEAPGDEKAQYDDYGHTVISKFTPEPGKTYRLELEVYKGFDEGERNLARRLVRPGYYKVVKLLLNLKRYVDEGYTVSGSPQFSVDNKYDKSASSRHNEEPMEGKKIDAGVWQWEINNIREGVLRLTWDVRRY